MDFRPAPAAREAYRRVTAGRGTFGERLEVCAISALLGCPVELYYYLDGDGDATAASPKETIAAEAASPSASTIVRAEPAQSEGGLPG